MQFRLPLPGVKHFSKCADLLSAHFKCHGLPVDTEFVLAPTIFLAPHVAIVFHTLLPVKRITLSFLSPSIIYKNFGLIAKFDQLPVAVQMLRAARLQLAKLMSRLQRRRASPAFKE